MERTGHKDPEAELHEELEKLAQKHLGGSLGLELLEFDPLQYPDQQLTRTHNPVAESSNLETIYNYARLGAGESQHPGRFDYLVAQFQARPDLLNSIKEGLSAGQNIAVVTNHSQLHDIAVVQAALVCALNESELIPQNAIVLSKLITRFRAYGFPATAILGNLAHTYFSIPRTKSIFRSGIDNDIASLANNAMRRDLNIFLKEPAGKLVAIAPSGSTDERQPDSKQTHVMTLQRMSSGTAQLLESFNQVLPVAIWLEADEDRYSIAIGDPLTVHTEDQAHNMMEAIAKDLSHLAGITTFYEEERLSGLDRLRHITQQAAEIVLHRD